MGNPKQKPVIKYSAAEVEYPDKRGANLFILTGVGNSRPGLTRRLGSWGTKVTLTAWMVLVTFVAFMFK